MKLKIIITFAVAIFLGQVHYRLVFADTIYTEMRPGFIGYTLITDTPQGDEIRMKYEATSNDEKKIQRSFVITVITHNKDATFLGENRDRFELNNTFREFFKDRGEDASFFIELQYPVGGGFYSRREVMQGFTKPAGVTRMQVLKYPVYSNVGGRTSDIKNGVLKKVESVCYMTIPNTNILHILSGDLDQTLFRRTECVEINPQEIVFDSNGEISTFKGE